MRESAAIFDELRKSETCSEGTFDSLYYRLGLLAMQEGFDCIEFMSAVSDSHSELYQKARVAIALQELRSGDFREVYDDPNLGQYEGIMFDIVRAKCVLAFPRIWFTQLSPDSTDTPLGKLIQEEQRFYLAKKRKSAFVCGFTSVFLPGVGKWIAGSAAQFVFTLMPNLMYGIQSYEAYKIGGVRDPRFIVMTSIGGIFYAGNIYSSANSAKRSNKIDYDQMREHIIDFVNISAVSYLESGF